MIEDTPVWHLQVKNSFLDCGKDVQLTTKLRHFWVGYIWGFVETAVPAIRRLIIKGDLDPEEKKRIEISPASRVKAVEYKRTLEDGVDEFDVEFVPSRFTSAIEAVWQAREQLADGNNLPAMTVARRGLEKATMASDKHDVGGLVADLRKLNYLSDFSDDLFREIDQGKFGDEGQAIAKRWVDACEAVLNALVLEE
jgi:hypothetical protein